MKNRQLNKLFDCANRGSKGFKDESTKPYIGHLTEYASKCKNITELGINTGCSTLVFLVSGCKKVYSYNIVISQNAIKVKDAAFEDGAFFKLINKDNLKIKIKKTDLLFIDTDHWYGQIKAELIQHHTRVRKWIIMNNTETFGLVNPFDGRPGMKHAIYEFIEEFPEWKVKDHFVEGHGLTILEKKEKSNGKWWSFKTKKVEEEFNEPSVELF
jgi:hypothetical protein